MNSENRGLRPEVAARLPILKDVATWEDLAPDRLRAWSAPYGQPESWDVQTEDLEIPGPHGSLSIRIYRPSTRPLSECALVWFHGGGFTGGSIDMPEAHEVALGLAGRADATVISVNYQLCPQPGTPISPGDVRFPVAHDEAVAAFLWVVDQAGRLGLNPSLIAIGGASAGANLAAGAALRLTHEKVPVWQVLLAYPVVHPQMPTPSEELEDAIRFIPEPLKMPAQTWVMFNENYLGASLDTATEYAFAGIADELADFPRTCIDNAEFDELRASGEVFTRQLRDAGVDVEQYMSLGVLHGHLNNVGFAPAKVTLDRFACRLSVPVRAQSGETIGLDPTPVANGRP